MTEKKTENAESGNNDDFLIPVAFCTQCKKKTPIKFVHMVNKEAGLELTIISCPTCDIVLNLDQDADIEHWDEERVKNELGWTLEECDEEGDPE